MDLLPPLFCLVYHTAAGCVHSLCACIQVEEKLESLKEENSQQLEELQEEKNEVLAKMAALKKILYGKFGDSINLEED